MRQWFLNLKEYFPAKEMKTEEHMACLLEEKSNKYKVETNSEYTLVYYEEPGFLFIDYILIFSSSRGSGIGSKLMERIKNKNKPILLEVDPISSKDPESVRRVRFYEKLHFKKVHAIQYVRKHPMTGEKSEMDIFFWSPHDVTDAWILEKMKKVYTEVHAFQNAEFYGTVPKPASAVLQLHEQHTSNQVK
ncbi:GNAT family N-acetyltransferase [Planococcus sp. CPCC 101016]|uniref:GNAT family N-acetyltransferase n=1 Tax=Planococcus sp. CPCC 101016 TaxID=2599617 RepID=UPI0011B5185B|nr:GNAT family N-acetyltransferase [Planococcus sp. CPCC 101016]TWT07741.1 GNAT family N-acetyltransferase [Planococcus sp. CPCC 101016]